MGVLGPSREQTAFAKGLYLCLQLTLKFQKAAREICAVKIKAAVIKQEFPLSQGGGRQSGICEWGHEVMSYMRDCTHRR